MSKKVLTNIIAALPVKARKDIEQSLFLLQLLSWGKLSQEGKLPEELSFLAPEVINFNLQEILDAFKELSGHEGLSDDEQVAFSLELNKRKIQIKEQFFKEFLKVFVSSIKSKVIDFSESVSVVLQMPESSRGEQLSLPEELIHFMCLLTETKAKDIIYCPFDYKLQLTYGLSQQGNTVFTECLLGRPQVVNLLNILGDGRIFHQDSDPINTPAWTEDGTLKKFDVSVAVVPFGRRVRDGEIIDLFNRNFPDRGLYYEIYALLHLLSQSKKRVVALIPNNLLERSSAGERIIKDRLMKDGQIETVISLPEELFSVRNISTSLMVLKPKGGIKKTLFVKGGLDNFSSSEHIDQLAEIVTSQKEVELISCLADYEECSKNEFNLSVERYVLSGELRKTYAYLDTKKTVGLSTIATITRSQMVRASKEKALHSLPFVGLQDLKNGNFVSSASGELQIDDDAYHRVDRNLLQPLDVLVATKGTVGKIGLVTSDLKDERWLAGQMFHVLRIQEEKEVWAYYLFMYLRSEMGQTLLHSISSGAYVKMIRPADLRKLPIPVPTKKDLKSAKVTFDEEAKLIEEISALQTKKKELLQRHWPV